MVLTFLMMVAMVPAAHATEYQVRSDEIWRMTDIVLDPGQTITISGGHTQTNYSEILEASLNSTVPVYIADINTNTADWTQIDAPVGTYTPGGKDYITNQWTWGIGTYTKNQGIPRVWTGADGGSGAYWFDASHPLSNPYAPLWGYGDPGLSYDEWITTLPHGALIGYIDNGTGSPLNYQGILSFQNNPNLFFIGSDTFNYKSITGGRLYIGTNDDWSDLVYGPKDNFGYAHVNIPEPGSMLLLFFGLMGVLGLRRKFKK